MNPHDPITDPTDPHFGCDPTTIVVYEDGSSICDAPGADADYEAAAASVAPQPTTTAIVALPDTAADAGEVPVGAFPGGDWLLMAVCLITLIVALMSRGGSRS
jgi:hypothetical protein